MRKPVWRRDWAGFSGGWYGGIGEFGLTVLGVYRFGYSVDIGGPIVGDVRVGYQTKWARENPYRSPSRSTRRFYCERRTNAELRDCELEAERMEARRVARRRPPSWADEP